MNPESQPDLPQAQPASDPLATLAALEQHTRMLWKLLQATLVSLLLLCLGVNGYLYKQTRLLRNQLLQEGPAVNRMSLEFQNHDLPLFRNFASKLQNYAHTHREFLPILDRYRSALEPYMLTMPPSPASSIAPSSPQAPRQTQPRPAQK